LAQALPHELGESVDQFGRDAPLRVRQLALEKDDVGLDLGELRLLLCVLLGEPRIGCGEVALGNEVEQALEPGLERGLAGSQLAQLLSARVYRVLRVIEPAGEEIAQTLGRQ